MVAEPEKVTSQISPEAPEISETGQDPTRKGRAEPFRQSVQVASRTTRFGYTLILKKALVEEDGRFWW